MKSLFLILTVFISLVAHAEMDSFASNILYEAQQGDAIQQTFLGLSYEVGIYGFPTNYSEAAKWYRLAAEQGLANAQSSLATLYKEGKGVPVDYKSALKWERKAAYQGYSLAQSGLGSMYVLGTGVLEDYVEAYAWYSISAINGYKPATEMKNALKRELSSQQVTVAQHRAKELLAEIERNQKLASLNEGEAPSPDIAASGYGSGLLLKNGYILTCWHVVQNSEKISIQHSGKDFIANIVRKDEANDLAILRLPEPANGIGLSLSDADLASKVFTMGYPQPELQGSDIKFTTGTISSLTGINGTPLYYQISVPLQAGNSGGPLFDEKGNLVGIVAAKLDSLASLALTGTLPENVNYAIKADYLRPLLKTVGDIQINQPKTEEVDLLSFIEELKKSVVMIRTY